MVMVLSFRRNAGASEKHISPKCGTQIDPNDYKLVLMVCDFSEISIADQVVDAKALPSPHFPRAASYDTFHTWF
jgi:hypothetical protein